MPLLAIQLLWVNLVTDGLQDIALSYEKTEKSIMKRPPRNPKDPLLDKTLKSEIIFSGIFIGLAVFALWVVLLDVFHVEESLARGYTMAFMVFLQNMHATLDRVLRSFCLPNVIDIQSVDDCQRFNFNSVTDHRHGSGLLQSFLKDKFYPATSCRNCLRTIAICHCSSRSI